MLGKAALLALAMTALAAHGASASRGVGDAASDYLRHHSQNRADNGKAPPMVPMAEIFEDASTRVLFITALEDADRRSNIFPGESQIRQRRQSLQRRAEAFVSNYYQQMTQDIGSLRAFYADTVDYDDRGLISRDEVMEEHAQWQQWCRTRAYNVDFQNATLRALPERKNRFELYFQLESHCGDGQRQTVRRWHSYVVLDVSAPGFLIEAVYQNGGTASR